MQLMGKRSLAWALKWITDVAILLFLALLVWVLVILVMQRLPQDSYAQQGSVYVEFKLPTEIVEPTRADIEVYNFEASNARIHFRTDEMKTLDNFLAFSNTIVFFGITLWILWLVRQVLASLVANAPLTTANVRRFRIVGLLLVLKFSAAPLWNSLQYLRLQEMFELIPARGFLGLYVDHFDKTGFFIALLVVLMAEVLRIGAEHRVDSEAVV